MDAILDTIGRRRLGLTTWQSLVGQLRSLVPGLPGSEGQFSLLQAALVAQRGGRVRISSSVREQLLTFVDLFEATDDRPMHLEELIPGDPIHMGACDAAKPSAGRLVPARRATLGLAHPFSRVLLYAARQLVQPRRSSYKL